MRSSRCIVDWEEILVEFFYDGDLDFLDFLEDDIIVMEVDIIVEVEMKDEGDESEVIKEEDLVEGKEEVIEIKEEDFIVKDEGFVYFLNGILKEEENDNIGEVDVKEEFVQFEVKEEEKFEWIEFEVLVIIW